MLGDENQVQGVEDFKIVDILEVDIVFQLVQKTCKRHHLKQDLLPVLLRHLWSFVSSTAENCQVALGMV